MVFMSIVIEGAVSREAPCKIREVVHAVGGEAGDRIFVCRLAARQDNRVKNAKRRVSILVIDQLDNFSFSIGDGDRGTCITFLFFRPYRIEAGYPFLN
jgi:hypothetical protein